MARRKTLLFDSSKDEEGVVAVIEFLTAFTLFLMILTVFMSLVQLELGSNDPLTDRIDKAAVEGLERLTNNEGWFVPYVDGNRDVANSTSQWYDIGATALGQGALQPGIVSDHILDEKRVDALKNVSLDNMVSGLGLSKSMQLRLVIKVESSNDESRVGLILFDGGADRNTASISSVASRTFTSNGEVTSVSLEVHNGGRPPPVLRISEMSARPANNGPEWIEVVNLNGFALSLDGWSLERDGGNGQTTHLFREGVVPGQGLVLFSGDPSSQIIGNATEVFDLGSNGFLGYGSLEGLDDNQGRLRLLFAQVHESSGSQICRIDWTPVSGMTLNSTIVWNGGSPSQASSWNVSNSPTPGQF
ncbi:MAG: lamin tail domain-containing protein [Candidatus Poseidoniales archaeon]